MPVFEVFVPSASRGEGVWDGKRRIPNGSRVRIDKKDYKRLLGIHFKPCDPEAEKDMAEIRAKLVDINGKPMKYVEPPFAEAGDLDPNNPVHLQRLAEESASMEVIEEPAEPKAR